MQYADFDYGEFKEINWIIMGINGILRDIIRNIMIQYFNSHEILNDFKYDRINKI